MRDGLGHKIQEGNLIQVMLGQTPVRGYVLKVKEGGMSVLTAGKNQPQGVTPDQLVIQVDVALTDTAPGQPHPMVIRIPDPGKEVIVPVVTKDVA
jgi:hypothetical protein